MNVVKNGSDLSPLFLHYICLSLKNLIEKTHPHGKIGRNHLESKKHLHPRSKSQMRKPRIEAGVCESVFKGCKAKEFPLLQSSPISLSMIISPSPGPARVILVTKSPMALMPSTCSSRKPSRKSVMLPSDLESARPWRSMMD